MDRGHHRAAAATSASEPCNDRPLIAHAADRAIFGGFGGMPGLDTVFLELGLAYPLAAAGDRLAWATRWG